MPNDVNARLLPVVQELLPCPFCGGTPYVNQYSAEGAEIRWWNVACTAPPSRRYKDPTLCFGVSGPRKQTEAEAIKAWNARATPPMPAEDDITPRIVIGEAPLTVLYPHATPPMPAGVTEAHKYANLGELELEDAMVFAMLTELHANVPEIERPMSWSDLSTEQADRARKAVRAVAALAHATPPPEAEGWRDILERLNDLHYYMGTSESPMTAAQAQMAVSNFAYLHLRARDMTHEQARAAMEGMFAASPVGDDEG